MPGSRLTVTDRLHSASAGRWFIPSRAGDGLHRRPRPSPHHHKVQQIASLRPAPVRDRPPMKLAREPPRSVTGKRTQTVERAKQSGASAPPTETSLLLYRGCSASSAHPIGRARLVPVSSRGGAINRRDRLSSALTLKAATGLTEAASFALAIGLGLNRFVTIHWQTAGASDDLAATGQWLKLAGDWIRSRGGQFAYLWVRENGPDKGAHVHILMHLPPDLAHGFNRRQQGWVKACGAKRKRNVLYSRPIGRNYHHYSSGWIDGRCYDANLSETLDYVLKGADDAARAGLGIKRSEHGGHVVGKRCGTSVSLGASVRNLSSASGHSRPG